jgi:GNAT superfamily N-acetyltransferase
VTRPGTADDVAALVAAYEWLFAPPGSTPPQWDPHAAAARLTRAISSDRAEVLVAEADGEIAGLCTVYLDLDSVRFGPRAWVEDLAVDPSQRSRGHGKALLDAAKDWARAHGATHLELDSGEARADAHRFYERERPSWRSVCFAWEL